MEKYNEDVDTSQESTNEDETSKNEEDLTSEVERLRKENEDLKEQRRGLSQKVKASKIARPKSTNSSDERLDRLELRQIDSELTAEQITDILAIKNTKGIEDVSDAYNEPMVQAFLNSVREKNAKKQNINKAIPSSQSRNASSAKAKKGVSNSKNWVKEMPRESTQEVANALAERFFGN